MSQHRLAFPEVAVDFMNHDHHEFAALREKLLALIAPGSAAAGIDPLLDELHQHTVRHFADEEKLMQETGFPVYPVHKDEHDSVLADMAARYPRSIAELAAIAGVGEAKLARYGSAFLKVINGDD